MIPLKSDSGNSWYYSPDHGQLCQVIEVQALSDETICRVWLPGLGARCLHPGFQS